MERETRQELALPDAPGAALWSSGDQRGALLIPQDMASKNDSIFFMSSNQATKVKAFRVFLAGGGGA